MACLAVSLMLILALFSAGCVPPATPKTAPTEPNSLMAATLVPREYSELLGFPAHPSATTLTLAQLRKALGLKYSFMIDDLTLRHTSAGKTADDVRVRLLESFSRAYPIYLQTDRSRKCDGKSFVCETLSTPNTLATPYDITIVVGWSVELGSNVSTGGHLRSPAGGR
jgi:hypothetical protein